jgi:hypothetical protein
LSSKHSNVAAGSLEENWNVALALGLEVGGPELIVVSGTAPGEPDATVNGDRVSTSPHTRPAAASTDVVTSTQLMPSQWSRRASETDAP